MPRPRPPPTPASSTDITAQQEGQDLKTTTEPSFVLPPPAMNRSPPTTPTAGNGLQRKRTLSGSGKARIEQTSVELPPPPSRARKIIQMKPKSTEEEQNSASTSKIQTSPPAKRKQPSATSAAGRKIARKTAHSIIERRRRSKMNEEFGVLKDMIPACKGVEMHKLAILQAGIEYVRYLQGCVDRLQTDRNYTVPAMERPQVHLEDEDDEEEEDEDVMEAQEPVSKHSSPVANMEPAHLSRRPSIATTATASTHPSPAIHPSTSNASLISHLNRFPPPLVQTTASYSVSPPPLVVQTPLQTGVSPAFNAIHFSPDLSRTNASSIHNAYNFNGKMSPNILPLPQAAMSMGDRSTVSQEDAAEATATAALMMLTNDRRTTSRPGGMSVKDLLSG